MGTDRYHEDQHEAVHGVRTKEITGAVAEKIGRIEVVVNKGSRDGVRPGATLAGCSLPAMTITDPLTKEVLGTYSGALRSLGFEVTTIAERFSIFSGDDQREPSFNDKMQVGDPVVIRNR